MYAAQTAAIKTARNGTVTRDVDHAARRIIGEEGYGRYFTHRLGHGMSLTQKRVICKSRNAEYTTGIGLEVHESPYLVGGSNDIILTGNAFSDEPGIYIEGEVRTLNSQHGYIDHNYCVRLACV